MNVQAHVCIGGTNVGEDIRKLDFGQHVVVGTPGRTFDMIRRRNLRTRNIKLLILDEADEMLNRGFKEQIYDVYRYLPPATQVSLGARLYGRVTITSGCLGLCHPAPRDPRDDTQVHVRSDSHFGET